MINDVPRSNEPLRDKLAETRDNIVDMAHIATDSVRDKFHALKDKAAEKYGDGKQKMHELEENLARRVQEAPMKSVLIAAGVGLVLGFLWRRS